MHIIVEFAKGHFDCRLQTCPTLNYLVIWSKNHTPATVTASLVKSLILGLHACDYRTEQYICCSVELNQDLMTAPHRLNAAFCMQNCNSRNSYTTLKYKMAKIP